MKIYIKQLFAGLLLMNVVVPNTQSSVHQDSLCCVTNDDCCRGKSECFAHTFFKPRQITPNNMLQDNLSLYWWYHDVLCDEDSCHWFTAQITPFLTRSNREHRQAQYFLPCQQCEITVKEDGTGDVGSLWLNLIAGPGMSFDRLVAIRPRRMVEGVYFNFRMDFSRFVCNTWASVSFAAMHAKHDLNLCEVVPNPFNPMPGTKCDVTTVKEALNQCDWCFGKFSTEPRSIGGVDDVQIKIGYDWFFCDINHISPYFVVIAPTGKRTCPEFIFEPIVGSKHTSVGVGFIGEYTIWENCQQNLTLLTDFKYRYVLENCETRSFDLCKNGDWSRYLQVVHKCARSNSMPGINLFTQNVNVTPRSVIDWWFAAHYQMGNLNAEIGYDFWWRQRERIELCCFPEGFGIYDIVGDCNINPVSASCAEICQSVTGDNKAPSDSSFVELTACDLNLDSGATPSGLSNTIYGAMGYNGEYCGLPILFGAGGSFEWGRRFDTLTNWMIWAKFGLAY